MSYTVVSQIFGLVRMFIDNPLEALISYESITMKGIIEGMFIIQYWPAIMHMLTFIVVGGVYKSGEFPLLGSVLYFLVFWLNSQLLTFLVSTFGVFGLYTVIIPFMIICLIELILMCVIRENLFPNPGICRFI